jgi:hypothetical protein
MVELTEESLLVLGSIPLPRPHNFSLRVFHHH